MIYPLWTSVEFSVFSCSTLAAFTFVSCDSRAEANKVRWTCLNSQYGTHQISTARLSRLTLGSLWPHHSTWVPLQKDRKYSDVSTWTKRQTVCHRNNEKDVLEESGGWSKTRRHLPGSFCTSIGIIINIVCYRGQFLSLLGPLQTHKTPTLACNGA